MRGVWHVLLTRKEREGDRVRFSVMEYGLVGLVDVLWWVISLPYGVLNSVILLNNDITLVITQHHSYITSYILHRKIVDDVTKKYIVMMYLGYFLRRREFCMNTYCDARRILLIFRFIYCGECMKESNKKDCLVVYDCAISKLKFKFII